MPFVLLEAVPNLSLAPEDEALEATLEALEKARSPGWALLDLHHDPDHARTVLTLAGAAVPLIAALETMLEAALGHGSLQGHDGVHPRIGLVDVLPLVALDHARERDARRLGLAVARKLADRGVPVHRYGKLATREEHRVLGPIRRTHHELALPGSAARHAVDLGPRSPDPRWGCTCVGVRDPLVAYNVVLSTTDREIASAIASSLRASHPDGLPGVQALTFPLESHGGAIQVSCNLTDVAATGPADVFARVTQLAHERGVEVASGELVGLAPEAYLPEDPSSMGLDHRPESLEHRLRAAGLSGQARRTEHGDTEG